MSTSNTKQDTVAATVPLAMCAVARHMLDHRLPAPTSIEPPYRGEAAVRVILYPETFDVWVQSLADGAQTTTRPIASTSRGLRDREYVDTTGHVQAEIGLVAVHLRSSRKRVDHLVAVPTAGGVA